MASYEPEDHSSRDNDIQVINREESSFPSEGNEEYARHEPLPSPGFPALDIPSPNGDHSHLFNDFDAHEMSEGRDQHQGDQKHEGSFNPSLSPLSGAINGHIDEIGKDGGRSHERAANGTLTRLNSSAYVPPLPPLSEPVLPSASQPGISGNYLPNNFTGANRSQLMITGKKKKENQGSKGRPAFVMKIWSMVNDPDNQEFIRWDADGTTFQVYHREEFMKRILPKYFKHNNFASFVRQLNMYGWHKVQDISSGSMAKEAKNAEEVWQFKNPHFIKGREDLLENIVRHKSNAQEEVAEPTINLHVLVNELDQIKMNQLAIMEDMRRIRKDNQTLWTESFATRDRYQKQSQTLDKIMQFLAAVYGNSAGKIFEVENGTYDSNYGPPALYHGGQSPRPVYSTTAPKSKSRLMLMDQEHSKSPSSEGTSPTGQSKRPSVSGSRDGSIEEIVRNDNITPHDASANVNKIYQQIMNAEPGSNSPRHFFSELSSPAMPPHSPAPSFSRLSTSGESNADALQGLEQNIVKQGQALSQVQDWIQALANRQQQQQQQLQQQKGNSPAASGEFDDFDVNDFLNNLSNPVPSSSETHEHEGDDLEIGHGADHDARKRHIEEITDSEPRPKRGKTRSGSRR